MNPKTKDHEMMLLYRSHGNNTTLAQLSTVKLWQTTNHKKETEAKGIKQPLKEHQFECFLETSCASLYIIERPDEHQASQVGRFTTTIGNKKQTQPTHISRVQ